MDGLQAKAVYEPVAKLEAFYTGGAVRVTRDNQHLACACGDEVKVLDLVTGTVTRTLPGDSEPITSLALSPDKHTLVAASRSLAVRVWDWTTGDCKRTWKPHRAPVADMAVDASGGFVATGSADRSVKVTDLAGGFVTHHFTGHSGIVLRVLFHPRQLMLFSSCDQGEVRVWDLVTKAPAFKAMAKGHMSAVPALCLAPDGWHLLSGGRDKVVCVWDIRNGSRVTTLPVYEALEGLAVLPMGSAFPGVLPVTSLMQQGLTGKTHFFATAGERGVVRIWRSDTGACLYTYTGSSSSSVMLQQGGAAGAAGGSSGSAKKRQKTALGASEVVAAAAGNELLELLLLPGGKGLLAATGDARLLFFNPQVDGQQQQPAAAGGSKAAAGVGAGAAAELCLTRQLIGNLDEVTDLAFIYNTGSGGGLVLRAGEPRRVAVATNSHEIRLFELSDASCVGACVGHRDIVLCLNTARPAAGVELLASGAKDSEARVWDTATGACLAIAAGHVAAVTAVAWSGSKAKGGCYLATGGADKLLKLWDTSALLQDRNAGRTGPVSLSTLSAVAAHDKDVNALAFSPNDSLLATASQDRSIKLWRLPSLVQVATLKGHKRGVWDVAFSPAEQVLLSCSGDKLLKLWSVVDGTCLRTFEGHTGGVLRCSFITAGTQVLSSGADGLIKLWDTRSGTNLSTFESHDDRLWGFAVSQSPGEALLASGGADSRIVVWRDVTADKAAAAEAEEEQLVMRQQELSNALADGDYAAAARLAFQLRHPGRLLEVLRRQPGGPTAALQALQALVGGLQPEDLATALSYCREWNTNTRNAHLAQVLLRAILSRHTPQQILAVPGAAELVGGLLAYSQRHAARIDRLLRSTFLLDYTLAASQVLLPADAADAADAAEAADAAGGDGGGDGVSGRAQQLQQQQQHGAMNGLPNGHHNVSDSSISNSSSSSDGDDSLEDDADADEEDNSLSGSGEEEGSEDDAAAAAAAAGSSGRQRQQLLAAVADADADASKPDPALPGWGGGDNLSDDWEGPGEEDAADDVMMGSDDDVMGSDDDAAGAAGSSGSSDGSEDEEEEGEEASGSEGPGALASDSSEDFEQQQQQQQQRRGPVLRQQQQQQQVHPAAGAQRGSRRQAQPTQEQQHGAQPKQQRRQGRQQAAGNAAAAAGGGDGGAGGGRSSSRRAAAAARGGKSPAGGRRLRA